MIGAEDDYRISIDRLIQHVETAESKEDLLVLLTFVSRKFDHEDIEHDEEEVCRGLSRVSYSIHKMLILRNGGRKLYYRTALNHTSALRTTVLCSAIEMILRCARGPLNYVVPSLEEHFIPDLPKLLELFVEWDDAEDPVRLFTISNLIKIINRISYFAQHVTITLLDGTLAVVRGRVSSDCRVDAANTIARIVDQQDRPTIRKKAMTFIEKDASTLISTLSTAALSAPKESSDEILKGLFNLTVNSSVIRSKMAKRRCTILCINKHLSSENVESRKYALNICKCLLNNPHGSCRHSNVLGNTEELLVKKLIMTATEEQETMLQLYAISLLGDAACKPNLTLHLKDPIMQVLQGLAASGSPDGPAMEAAVTYMKVATAHDVTVPVLSTVLSFSTLPYPRARTMAICTLEVMSSDPQVARVLLEETEMLDTFSFIIRHGSDEDCADSMNVLRILASSERHHESMCANSGFLTALVELVTQDKVVNRNAYINGVETVLALMSKEKTIRCFLPYIDLLPWLVTFANATTSDIDLKQNLVATIVRFSSAVLA